MEFDICSLSNCRSFCSSTFLGASVTVLRSLVKRRAFQYLWNTWIFISFCQWCNNFVCLPGARLKKNAGTEQKENVVVSNVINLLISFITLVVMSVWNYTHYFKATWKLLVYLCLRYICLSTMFTLFILHKWKNVA